MAKQISQIAGALFCLLLLLPSTAADIRSSESSVNLDSGNFIVQAGSGTVFAALSNDIERYGGEVTRSLHVIDALAVGMPTSAVERLEQSPYVARLWPDHGVRTSNTADPGAIYAPVAATEYEPKSFDLEKVATCDGDRDRLDADVANVIDSNVHQGYEFVPNVDPSNLPNSIDYGSPSKKRSLLLHGCKYGSIPHKRGMPSTSIRS